MSTETRAFICASAVALGIIWALFIVAEVLGG